MLPGVLGRAVQPRVVAELARLRHGVKGPEPLAGAHVERLHVARAASPCVRVGSRIALPTTMTLPATSGPATHEVGRSDGTRNDVGEIDPARPSPNAGSGLPVRASIEIRVRVVGAVQQALDLAVGPVRQAAVDEARVARLPGLVDLRVVQPALLRPCAGSSAATMPERRHGIEDPVHHQRRVLVARRTQRRVRDLVVAIGRRPAPGHVADR